ncbi:MAG: methyltransferase domain-containing protein [Acidobacteriota bacterium]
MLAASSKIQKNKLLETLCCPSCNGKLSQLANAQTSAAEVTLECLPCGETFPVIDGIPRMLLARMREALSGAGVQSDADKQKAATAESFGYEWNQFSQMLDEYERNFFEYMQPRAPEFFRGKLILDAGCGSGRHAHYSAKFGATVFGVDLGSAIYVAKRNTDQFDSVLISQADLYNLPFALESFDFIYSMGVLHHLPEPEAAFRNLLRFLKPGGEIHIYLYWQPESQPVKNALLRIINLTRRITTRLPHKLLHLLSYPAAMLAFLLFVYPYKLMRHIPGLKKIAGKLPMKQYANYPFRVCVNDQFDRFSAPIENRYTKTEVIAWFERAGFENIDVRPNSGWCASGRKPLNS